MNASGMPLRGLQIVVTRPEGQAATLIARLEMLGATVLHAPTIRIGDPPSFTALDAALRHLPSYDWIVWTSANGVARTFARLEALGLDPGLVRSCHLAVIGDATARALASFGHKADLVPPQAVAESLRDTLIAAGVGAGSRLLVPQPVTSRDLLATGLRAAGAVVDVAPAYQTELNADAAANLRQWLAAGRIDCALVTSPSTVRGLLALLNGDLEALRRIPLACIGPVTADAVRTLGIEPALVATEHTNDGLIAALMNHRTGVRV
ncbi:MAG: uroporphyrinogen-III synthase [Chloroflexota bacterium]|nr:uroporphyrinogen-III synthase [Chloroflexota bacterium]